MLKATTLGLPICSDMRLRTGISGRRGTYQNKVRPVILDRIDQHRNRIQLHEVSRIWSVQALQPLRVGVVPVEPLGILSRVQDDRLAVVEWCYQ